MFLYHYSTNDSFEELLTVNFRSGKQHPVFTNKNEITKRFGDYKSHVSLFLDKVDFKGLASAFDNHPFWCKGNTITEYSISFRDIPEKINWEMAEVETTVSYSEYENLSDGVDKYWSALLLNKLKTGFAGESKQSMRKAILKCKTGIQQLQIEKAKEDPQSKRYAADVPHLMMYPLDGRIKIFSKRTFVI